MRTTFIKKPETLFVVLGAVFGLLFLVCVPPFQVADENRHFYRAFQVAEGGMISIVYENRAGGWLPKTVIQCGDSTLYMRWDKNRKITLNDILDLFQLKLNLNEREFRPLVTYVYSPVAYLPSAFLIRVGIWLKMPPICMMYAGRFVNLICWLGLIYMAICISPFYKWVFFLLALTPTSLYQGASLSADCLTNGLAFLTIAYFLHLAFTFHSQIKRKTMLILLLLTISLSLTKNIFFLLSFLSILVPSTKFSSIKHRFVFCFSIIIVNFFVFLAWCYIITRLPSLGKEGVFPDQQIKFILNSPIEYFNVLFNTIVQYLAGYYKSFMGAFGWQDVMLDKWHGRLWGGILLMTALTDGCANVRIAYSQKVLFFSLVTITFFSIITLNYIHWNQVAYEVVKDVQGRYFIPIGPLFLLLFYNTRFCFRVQKQSIILALVTIVSLVVAGRVFYERFYG